jgi:hypothetical protein
VALLLRQPALLRGRKQRWAKWDGSCTLAAPLSKQIAAPAAAAVK